MSKEWKVHGSFTSKDGTGPQRWWREGNDEAGDIGWVVGAGDIDNMSTHNACGVKSGMQPR